MRLYLIRHGQTDSNVKHLLDTAHPGAPLDELGLSQAEALADRMADVSLDAVYSSDLLRAVQTATPLAARRGLEVQQLPGLREIPAGVEEMNEDWSVYLATLDKWMTDPLAKLEGGEDANTFMTRFDDAIAQIAAANEVAALVSHGAALRVWTPFRATNIQTGTGAHRRLANTAMIVAEGDPEAGWRVLSWGDEPIG